MSRSTRFRASVSMRSTVTRLVPLAVALAVLDRLGWSSDEPVVPQLVAVPVSFSAIVPSALRGCALVALLLFAFAASRILSCSAFVVSLNLHLRHLSESQRAMVAAKLANLEQGARTEIEPSANLQKVSRAEAAEKLNVSERTVNAAKKVQTAGIPELQGQVEQGQVSVSAATW